MPIAIPEAKAYPSLSVGLSEVGFRQICESKSSVICLYEDA